MKYKVSFDLDFKRNTYKGKFIVLEGIEASGKTTQVKDLQKILSSKNTFFTKNPTDSEIGSFIRKEILSGNRKNINPISYQYLFAADRQIQQAQIIDKLKKGIDVVSDRYFWSSVAYGIADRAETDYKNWEEVSVVALSLLSMYHQFLLPDLSIYLDISFKGSLKRMSKSTKHTEIYDNNKMNIRIKKGYDFLLKQFKKEIVVLNAEQEEAVITAQILKLIKGIKK